MTVSAFNFSVSLFFFLFACGRSPLKSSFPVCACALPNSLALMIMTLKSTRPANSVILSINGDSGGAGGGVGERLPKIKDLI